MEYHTEQSQPQSATMGSSRRSSSAQSPYRLGRAVKGAWRRLSPSRGTAAPKVDRNDSSFLEDIKGPLGLNLLHEPDNPRIDFIFVHGLGGGSRKTWSFSADPEHYWPKVWLPKDPDFSSVRIHSFGYNAAWVNLKGSTMNILDFARSLLGDISCNPMIRRSNTRIVLVGHSMGGIVIKKAYMLAQEDHDLKHLANRIHTLYFLATPHSGSNFAKTLESILEVCYSGKSYVRELGRNSDSISVINDSFRHWAGGLELRSFYESEPFGRHFSRVVIVDQYSGISGLPGEKCQPLSADHSGVCKFSNRNDPNYQTLRNTLSATVDEILLIGSREASQISKLQLDKLVQLTGISDPPDQELSALEDTRVAGTCDWLIKKEVYKDWQEMGPSGRPLFWLSGNAGFGKSFLASRVINDLQNKDVDCSYFFFKRGNSHKSSVSGCLRALVYQMARADDSILRKLLDIQHNSSSWEKWDENMMWRKVFIGCVFKDAGSKIHYWVIDAVDECQKRQVLFNLLAKAPPCLRVLFTSRHNPDIEMCVASTANNVHHYHMQEEDTGSDFSKFIDSRMEQVPVSNGQGKEKLKQRILEKASGSFLWVSLVVNHLEEAYSEEEAEGILIEVPTDMNELYARMLDNVLQNRRTVALARAVYMWTLLSLRPLKIDGMQIALRMDNQTVPNLEKFIPAISGQLVCVNGRHEAEVVHQTAREYLLDQKAFPELVLDKNHCQTHITRLCLTLLAGNFTRGWQPQDQTLTLRQSSRSTTVSDFTDYACEYFSDHLQRSSSEDDVNWELLRKFLDSNLLIWIEYLAKKRCVRSVTRTAKNLRAYFTRRIKYLSPISPHRTSMETWIYDLFRLSAKFGTSLVTSPSSIYNLIPSMCPTESIFSRYLVSKLSRKGLVVRGLEDGSWDDCLARIDYPAHQTSAIACGDQYSAVALSDGTIYLYFLESTQLKSTLNHGGRANILTFSNEDKFLASSGQRKIKIWKPSEGIQLWAFDISHRALDLLFVEENSILAATTQGSYTVNWDLTDGQEIGRWQWTDSIRRNSTGKTSWPQPSKAVLSPDYKTLAVSYRGHPLYVFSISAHKFLGSFSRETDQTPTGTSNHYIVEALAFNPSLEIDALVVSYGDGELAVYDIELAQLRHRRASVFAHSLKCSPDGRTLITGSSRGTLQIFEFAGARGDCILPLYLIDAHDDGIRDIAFSSDSLRFADIRGSQCRVWEPAVLDCKSLEEGSLSEVSQAISVEVKSVGMLEGPPDPELTAMCCTPNGEFVFCGKKDGSVSYFETQTAAQRNTLYRHASDVGVTCILYIEKASLLVTADESGRVLVNSVLVSRAGCELLEQVAEIRSGEPVSALLHNDSGSKLLLRSRKFVEVWSTDGQQIGFTMASKEEGSEDERIFANHPSSPGYFISIGRRNVRIFSWADALEIQSCLSGKPELGLTVTPPSPILKRTPTLKLASTLKRTFTTQSTFNTSFLDEWDPPFLAGLFRCDSGSQSRRCTVLEIWPASSIVASNTPVVSIPLPKFSNHFDRIRQIVAVDGSLIFFLDVDLWICSIDIATTSSIANGAKRHFFLLPEWQSIDGSFLVEYVPATREFLVARKHRLLVIGKGLEFEEPWVDL